MNEQFDLAIIGGGINGVAIARDASQRGMKVILLEKEDFGSGASSKTSKLAHGGLRYLEHFEYKLVKESLKERKFLLETFPHLVTPLPFVIPVYKGDKRPLWQIKLGLYLYDFLSSGSRMPRHKNLTSEKIQTFFPGLKSEGLKGGCLYYDALMKDNRLIFENLTAAERNGAIAINRAKVCKIEKKGVKDQHIYFQEGSEHKVVRARLVVNACGAWSDQLHPFDQQTRVEPTKGVHLVIPQISKEYALLLHTPQDRRVFFIIPWEGYSLLGTTDTFYSGNLDDLRVNAEDRDYLLEAFKTYFPHLPPKFHQPISEFAGLRPLVRKKGKNPDAVSRSHAIYFDQESVLTVLGGKYTTYRKIAEDVVNVAAKELNWNNQPKRDSSRTCQIGLPTEAACHLIDNYQIGLNTLFEILENDQRAKVPLCQHHPHLLGEITYAVKFDHARSLEDWFFRRTSIGYSQCGGVGCLEKTADKFAELLGWSPSEREDAIQKFLNLRKKAANKTNE